MMDSHKQVSKYVCMRVCLFVCACVCVVCVYVYVYVCSGIIRELTQIVHPIETGRTTQTSHLPFVCCLSHHAFSSCSY